MSYDPVGATTVRTVCFSNCALCQVRRPGTHGELSARGFEAVNRGISRFEPQLVERLQ